jgi:hypothetical protein
MKSRNPYPAIHSTPFKGYIKCVVEIEVYKGHRDG